MNKIYFFIFIVFLGVPTNLLGSYNNSIEIKNINLKSVLISKKSEISFFNDISFRIFQNNCFVGNIYTTFPSKKTINLIREIQDKLIIADFGGETITIKIKDGFSHLNGSIILIDLGWKYIEDIKNFFEKKPQISLVLKNGEGFSLENYFNTKFNSWKLNGIRQALDKAIQLCKKL